MANYQFSEDAIKDLDEICDYIAQNNALIRTGLTQKPGFSTKNLDLSRSIQVRNPVSRIIWVSPKDIVV